jgi:hypothetical protein
MARHVPETHLIPLVLHVAAGRLPEITIFGDDYPTKDGTCVRDYIHVVDLARAHVLVLGALSRHDVGGRVYNLGCGRTGYSVREVIDAARRVTGKEIPVRVGPRRPGDPAMLIASSERIVRELGWRPTMPDLDDIIESAWRWMRKEAMKILGHVHTFNEERSSIDPWAHCSIKPTRWKVLWSITHRRMAHRDTPIPGQGAVIRHPENLLGSAAIITAKRYAIERRYEWIWILNGDRAPRKDALELLVNLYRRFEPEFQETAWLLASLPVDAVTQRRNHGFMITARGLREVRPPSTPLVYECDATIWSGSLYNLAAVQKTGLPPADYVMDIGELEYGYRGKRRGYRAFVHQGSLIDHNIGVPSVQLAPRRLGPISLKLVELQPFRC